MQSLFRRGMSDQVYDNRAARQRMSAPILRDMAEQPMLDSVPFAGAWRKMANRDPKTRFVGELLQADFPEPGPRSIATPAVRCHQQRVGVWILGSAHFTPPTQNGGRGKFGRVMIDAHIDPAFVLRDIEDPKGDRAPQGLVAKIMCANAARLPPRPPFLPGILQIPEGFFLFGTEREIRASYERLRRASPQGGAVFFSVSFARAFLKLFPSLSRSFRRG